MYICVKCRKRMKCSKTGGLIRWDKTTGQSADAYKCLHCGAEVMVTAPNSFQAMDMDEDYFYLDMRDQEREESLPLDLAVLRAVKHVPKDEEANGAWVLMRLYEMADEGLLDRSVAPEYVTRVLKQYVDAGVLTFNGRAYKYNV